MPSSESPTTWRTPEVLLDTSFLVDLMRGDEGAIRKATSNEADLVQQRLSAMTLFELFYGVARSEQADAEREQVEAVLSSKPVHAADEAIMRRAGRLAGEQAARGERVDDGDAIIAATALAVDEPVLTRNERDFEPLAGVEIASY